MNGESNYKVRNWLTRHFFGLLIILVAGAGITMQELVGSALIINDKRITGIKDDLADNSIDNLVTQWAVAQALAAVELTGGSNAEIRNIRDNGGVPDASVPLSGNNASGTNQLTALQTTITNAPAGATVLIGAGSWLIVGGITVTTKQLNIVVLGTVYTNGTDFLTFNGPGGADRQHTVTVLGTIIGRVNIPAHTVASRAAGTSPVWSTFTGAAITIGNNVNSMHVLLNKIEGFRAAVEILVTTGGSQENTIAGQKFNNNAIGISLRSTTGISWCDKNIFTGFNGGHLRISGGLALKIDGYSGAASTNGEIYNGAFRSDEFEFLAEQVDSVIVANGDITEPRFDITIEGGTTTGVLGSPAIQCRSVAPNFVRSPRWEGQGVVGTQWMVNGMGIDGTINMPVWLGPGSIAYIGNTGKIDGSGTILMDVKPGLAKATRDALPANIKCLNERIAPSVRTIATITGTSTAAVDAEGLIQLNSSPMAFTPGAANLHVNVGFYVKNLNASSATFFSVTGIASLAQNEVVYIRSDGTTWRALSIYN